MGANILAVDDDLATLEMLELALSARGHHVVCVADGTSALEAARSGPTDVVILDLMMAGLDGYEVLRRLRSAPDTARLPVLVLSALSRDTDIWEAFLAGADAYVDKPMDLDHLDAELARIVGDRSTGRSV